MKETLLATLGLMLVVTMSLTQRQSGTRAQMQNIEQEYYEMAIGVAKQAIEGLEARSFDQSLLNGRRTISQFTPESGPGWGGKDCIEKAGGHWQFSDACRTIEDFHDDQTEAMDNYDGVIGLRMPGQVKYFGVEMEVHYAKNDGSDIVRASPAETPTDLKEVTVRVRDCRKNRSGEVICSGDDLIMDGPISYSEVFAFEKER